MPDVKAREATVTTLSVSVKAMKIGTKQVTQSVFRQLEEAPLLDARLAWLGVPWGWVNYHWGLCHDHGRHLHVVWQDGDRLRRWVMPASIPHEYAGYSRAQQDEAASLISLGLAIAGKATEVTKECGQLQCGNWIAWAGNPAADAAWDFWQTKRFAATHDYYIRSLVAKEQRRDAEIAKLLRTVQEKYVLDETDLLGSLAERVQTINKRAADHIAVWDSRYEAVYNAGQLFIAV